MMPCTAMHRCHAPCTAQLPQPKMPCTDAMHGRACSSTKTKIPPQINLGVFRLHDTAAISPPMHRPMHGLACLSTPTPIRPLLIEEHWHTWYCGLVVAYTHKHLPYFEQSYEKYSKREFIFFQGFVNYIRNLINNIFVGAAVLIHFTIFLFSKYLDLKHKHGLQDQHNFTTSQQKEGLAYIRQA